MLDTDYLDAGQQVLRRIIINATDSIESQIYSIRESIKIYSTTLNKTLDAQYDNLFKAINQQSVLLYIVLGLLGLVTALIIVSILNQRKLKKELREMRELLESRTEPEDKPQ